MSDRTVEQINHHLDQVLAISAETSRRVDQLAIVVQDFIQSAKPRLLSLETSREEAEERLEEFENNRLRMERAHLEHQERLNRMDEESARSRREHQERLSQIAEQIARQDRLIELLERRGGETSAG
jgi:Na+-translocating ferredoxin:NAD+ oxidoreductase RnfC subunit